MSMHSKNKPMGIGRAHGKIILIGEHAVVYNQPAIALPFKEASVKTTVTPADEMTVDCIYHRGRLEDAPPELNNLKAVTKATLAYLNQNEKAFHIKIESDIPQERGMGSSAAVANATIRALFDFFDIELAPDVLFELAQVSERIAHGNPSGLDARVTVSEKPLFFIKNQGTEAFDIAAKGYLVVADTGEKGQTKLAVEALGEKKAANPTRINDLITKLGELGTHVRECLKQNDLHSMGEAMTSAQTYLAQMGISNRSLDRLVEAALNAGALGSKLTGGGWGGCMLALVPDLAAARQVREALLEQHASQTWLLSLE